MNQMQGEILPIYHDLPSMFKKCALDDSHGFNRWKLSTKMRRGERAVGVQNLILYRLRRHLRGLASRHGLGHDQSTRFHSDLG